MGISPSAIVIINLAAETGPYSATVCFDCVRHGPMNYHPGSRAFKTEIFLLVTLDKKKL
jgi:hypothetical protein